MPERVASTVLSQASPAGQPGPRPLPLRLGALSDPSAPSVPLTDERLAMKAAMKSPTTLRPGTVLRWTDGTCKVLRERKTTDDGWWIYGGGGLSDRVLNTSTEWEYIGELDADVLDLLRKGWQ